MKSNNIVTASDLGRNYRYPNSYKFIWHACEKCGKERYVQIIKGKPRSIICAHCSGIIAARRAQAKKPGKHRNAYGYILVAISADDTYASMRQKNGSVFEHRIVMARYLGRPLTPTEKVHHKNGIRDDNRIENLELVSLANNKLYTDLCLNCSLRKEIRLLRWQIAELKEALQYKLNFIGG